MNPSDDADIPKISFMDEGDLATAERCIKFLPEYASYWRAVFWNFAVLVPIASIGWLTCSSTEPNPGKWPWWIYPLALVLGPIGVLLVYNFFRGLYEVIRWAPTAIRVRELKRLLMIARRCQATLDQRAFFQKATEEAIKRMDPKDVEDLRKHGFL